MALIRRLNSLAWLGTPLHHNLPSVRGGGESGGGVCARARALCVCVVYVVWASLKVLQSLRGYACAHTT